VALAATEATALSAYIVFDMNSLAIIRESDGKVVTFVRPDQPQGWKPPAGTRAIPDTELPANWEQAEEFNTSEPITAEEHLRSVGLAGDRQPTLLYLRQSLTAAGKTCTELDAVEAYLQQILTMFAANPAPQASWPNPSVTFEAAVQSAMNALNS
jgi:hypothetical protein